MRNFRARYKVGRIEHKLDEADEQFRKALELKPNHYLAYFHLGVIYSKKDKEGIESN